MNTVYNWKSFTAIRKFAIIQQKISPVISCGKIRKDPIVFLFIICILFSVSCFCQHSTSSINPLSRDSFLQPVKDTSVNYFYLKTSATITNKGISYIPNFSLGKPAVIFDLSLGNGKLFFEPQLRFSLVGEPWTFLFPVRYKIKATGKFQLTAALCPLLNFKYLTVITNGISTTELVNRRYFGGEFRPNYFITKNISAGFYSMYFRGIGKGSAINTTFVSFTTAFSNLRLFRGCFAKINAQVYYLNQDGREGFYLNPMLTILKKDFPLSVQTIMNANLWTEFPGSEKFIWNVSLIYTFNGTYTGK
jgi:hypothetical protein